MWITDSKGALRNLNLAHKIEIGTSAGVTKVYATFALSGDKRNDAAFYEMSVLATFDDETAAKKFLDDLKDDLNAESMTRVVRRLN